MSNVENVCPQVLRGVSRELRRLAANPPAGVKLVLRDDDFTDVVAHIDGPAGTPYCGGVFRVRLALGAGFPASPPRAFFVTRIFHPNVSPATGEVCVNTLKRDWRPELGLEHALVAVRCLLIAPNAESALNAEAAALLRDRYDDYFARAKLLADIHARPAAPRALQDEVAAEGGPCAKRERRGVAVGEPSHRDIDAEDGDTGASATTTTTSTSTSTSTGTSTGTSTAASTGSASTGTSTSSARPAKDRRRILKRL